MTTATGVERLDELLGGGLPDGSATLVLGSPDTGIDVLARRFVLQGAREGMPSIVVLTDATASETSDDLEAIDPDTPAYEDDGSIRYVDTYTATVGTGRKHPAATYVGSATDLNALTGAMNEVQSDLLARHGRHRVVVDNVSTVIVNAEARPVFRFLQVFLGRTRQAGGTAILLMNPGLHDDRELQLIRHLTDGVVETRRVEDEPMLRVEGLGLNTSPGWVEYDFDTTRFEITGSLGTGRIR